MATLQDHIEAINRYVQGGCEPGSCTRAILENNLYYAVANADATSRLLLADIMVYVYNHLPGEAWGSRERVDAWAKARREKPIEDLYSVLRGAEYARKYLPYPIRPGQGMQLVEDGPEIVEINLGKEDLA